MSECANPYWKTSLAELTTYKEQIAETNLAVLVALFQNLINEQ